jgi:hypothetical protein
MARFKGKVQVTWRELKLSNDNQMYTLVRAYGKFLDWPHEQIHLAAPSANETCTGPDLTLAALMGEHEHCTEATPLHVSFAAFEGAEAAAAAGADEKNGL